MAKRKPQAPLVRMRASISRMRSEGKRMVSRLRRDVSRLAARSRKDILQEVREFERGLVKRLHAATEDEVARLEGRVSRLERALADLRKPATEEQVA